MNQVRKPTRAEQKAERYRQLLPYLKMKKVMYSNIPLYDSQAASSTFLNWISEKKKTWYLKNSLATPYTTQSHGPGIRLNFKSKESPNPQPPTDLSPKTNSCVICASGTSGYMRHHILPSSLRTLLPKKYKSHLSHDVVLVCPDCFQTVQSLTAKRQTLLEKKSSNNEKQYVVNYPLKKIITSSTALLKYSTNLPPPIKSLHLSTVSAYLSKPSPQITDDDLLHLSNLPSKIPNPSYVSPSLSLIQSLKTPESLELFVREWRKFFIDTFKPRNMPGGWKVENRVTNDGSEGGMNDGRVIDTNRGRTVTEVYEEELREGSMKGFEEEKSKERVRTMTEELHELARIREGLRSTVSPSVELSESKDSEDETTSSSSTSENSPTPTRLRTSTYQEITSLVSLRTALSSLKTPSSPLPPENVDLRPNLLTPTPPKHPRISPHPRGRDCVHPNSLKTSPNTIKSSPVNSTVETTSPMVEAILSRGSSPVPVMGGDVEGGVLKEMKGV